MSNNKSVTPELVFPQTPDLVDLPSRGKFYKFDHPLHEQTCVEILQMRAIEEDILTNRDLIRREMAIDRLLLSLLTNNELKSDKNFNQILVADQAAMILKARITAYTWEYPVTFVCPKCGQTIKYKFDLRKSTFKDPSYEDDENIKYDPESNLFSITIPNTLINVLVTPITIGTQRKLKNKLLNKKKKELSSKEQYEDMIISINGSNNPVVIAQFFENIPAFYFRWFKAVIDDINPSLSLLQSFECENCGHQEDIEPPFTTDFLFTPKMKRADLNRLKTESGSE